MELELLDIGCVLFTNECTNFGQSPAVRVTDSMTLGQAAQSHRTKNEKKAKLTRVFVLLR